MADTDSNPMHRRTFIQNSAAATVAATALTPAASVAQDNTPATPSRSSPQAHAGQDRGRGDDPQRGNRAAPGALDRLLRFEYSRGVRFFDTAASYGTEEAFKKWFAAMPEARRQIFLATKDGVRAPRHDQTDRSSA